MWGCINGWYRLAHQNQNSTYVADVRQLFTSCFVQCRVQPIRRLTHVVWKCFLCPQNVNLPISIWLYSTIIFFTFWKWNRYGNNSLTLGIYSRSRTSWQTVIPLLKCFYLFHIITMLIDAHSLLEHIFCQGCWVFQRQLASMQRKAISAWDLGPTILTILNFR